MRMLKYAAVVIVLLLTGVRTGLTLQDREEKLAGKYYEKWLNEDVVYIITQEERDVFARLNTPEEKDVFIEEFWRRRSADPSRSPEEYKIEHYRRIAFANAKFGSGIPGWKTDRGRVYIMFGEPSEIQDHAGGEHYRRPSYEGGGNTTVYPFQVWRYRHIEGVGDDIEIEFVDQSWTGLYKMAMNSWEKDLLLYVDGEGQTTAERLGLAQRNYRPGLHPGAFKDSTIISRNGLRSRDMPFERMMQYFQLQRPPVIRNKELQGVVTTHVTYNELPFHYTLNYVWMDAQKALAPITFEIENKSLEYRESYGNLKARVGLYGVVTGLNGRVIAEFEDTIASEYTRDRFEQGQKQKSMYQRPVLVPPGLYRVDLVVKDLQSGKMNTLTTNLNVPRFESGALTASPIVLAKMIEPLAALPDAPQSFVIGDLKVVPNVAHAYTTLDPLSIYFQVYNATTDQADSMPKLVTEYSILQGNKVLTHLVDNAGTSIEYASEQRAVLARRINLQGLVPGTYTLKIEVRDAISGQSVVRDTEFEIKNP